LKIITIQEAKERKMSKEYWFINLTFICPECGKFVKGVLNFCRHLSYKHNIEAYSGDEISLDFYCVKKS